MLKSSSSFCSPTPIANILTPFFLARRASNLVLLASVDPPSVMTIATRVASRRPPKNGLNMYCVMKRMDDPMLVS